jgi:ATP-dependent protease HslVU (ClpYQ) peptidase subunit
MTTIAYHHGTGVIACDGRTTQGGYICHDEAEKWLCIGDDVWFFTGCVGDRVAFVKYHAGELSGVPLFPVDCAALVASGGLVYELGLTDKGEAWRVLVKHDHATGSGRDHAIAAMDYKQGAIDAVKYASTRDIYTGGKIRGFDVSTMKFM